MKESMQTEKFAADTILQKGVKVKVPAPFFIRWFKKTIALKLSSPLEGTMHRVASYYLATGMTQDQLESLTTEEALQLQIKHGKTISRAVAVAILNGYWSGKLLTKPLAWYLRWHLKPRELYVLTTTLLLFGGVQDFINTTKSVRQMKLTTPRTGQHQGS